MQRRLVEMRTHAIDRLLRLARSPGVISLAGGLPAPETFPREALIEASRKALSGMGGAALQYDWPEGQQALRAQVAARLRERGAQVDAEDVLITCGAQDALALTLAALQCTELEVDAATYAGAIDLFESLKIRTTSRERAAVCYVMPAVHNPWGWSSTPLQRAAALSAEWVIEDDAYAELRFDGGAPTPLLAEAPERVFHIGTVSKTLSPGLRIGWLVAPRQWQRRVRELKSVRDVMAPGLSQAIVENLMSTGTYDVRLSELRSFYSRRCDVLLALLPQLPKVRFTVPVGGFSIWLEVDCGGVPDEQFLRCALKEGVAVDPGVLFRAEPEAHPGLAMRLSFSATPLEQLPLAIERLGRALEQLRSANRPLVA